jgi:hypothetical protein
MAQGQINFNLDSLDDVVLPDQVPSFEGGQFSNLRANLLQPNQSKLLVNADVDRLGKIRTRRGTIRLGTGPPSGVANTIIQGLVSYQTPTANYVVSANNGKIWKYTDGIPGTWTQIALGGIQDNADILIYRLGLINNPAVVGPPAIPEGYPIGATVLSVDGLPAMAAPILAPGEKLYFTNNLRTDYYEYTIASFTPGAHPPSDQITLEEPGLVFPVHDNWQFVVARPAKVNNGAGYPAGYTGAIAIDGYTGTANVGEYFLIKSENVSHRITAASGTPTTSITFATLPLQADYAASDATVPIVFAQGNDKLYFCDGVGAIYAWDGAMLMNISTLSMLDFLTGSALHQTRTTPPTGCKILIWFQNRLIASGIAAEPDAIYFSDYFDGTSWDKDYQKVRIGGGESDPITGLLAWTDYNLLVFKKNSIYVINLDPNQNPTPDDPTLLVASFSVKQLHKKIGCPAPLTAVQVGGGSTTPGSDVFFMDGDKKVHSIRRVLAAEQQQEVGQAVSLPIQDVLDTISLDHIDRACATYHNEHYILGYPSTRGEASGIYPNAIAAYNLLTQSWCGKWDNWRPTCFAMRTDLGSYSKMIFGESKIHTAADGWTETGNVLQWLDDVSLEDETTGTYQDYGHPIKTSILTRAFTGGDFYSFKTGLNVELEFDESVAEAVTVRVFLDKIEDTRHGPLTVLPFSTLTEQRLRLPVPGGPPLTLPFTLPSSPDLMRLAFDLQRYGTWRELQFLIESPSDKLAIRSIRLTFFIDSLRLQTVPLVGIPALDVPASPTGGGP